MPAPRGRCCLVEDLSAGSRRGSVQVVRAGDQHLLWVRRGTLLVETASASWPLAPTVALWLPPGTLYVVVGSDGHPYHRLHIPAETSPLGWEAPTPLSVDGLARESLLALRDPTIAGGQRARLEAVVLDAVGRGRQTAGLPMPTDDRLRAVTRALLDDPRSERSLADWGHDVGASSRTLSRLFPAETGLTFAQWRLLARMSLAAAMLADGVSLAHAARAVGYRSPSAFVHAYRRTTGRTPRQSVSRVRHVGG